MNAEKTPLCFSCSPEMEYCGLLLGRSAHHHSDSGRFPLHDQTNHQHNISQSSPYFDRITRNHLGTRRIQSSILVLKFRTHEKCQTPAAVRGSCTTQHLAKPEQCRPAGFRGPTRDTTRAATNGPATENLMGAKPASGPVSGDILEIPASCSAGETSMRATQRKTMQTEETSSLSSN